MQKSAIKPKLSAMMLFQFFIQGSWYVTMGTYLGKTLGFTGVQIGLAYSTAAIAAIISPVVVGMIADRFFSANRVLAFLNITGALLLFWLTRIDSFSLFFPVLLFYSICFMPTMSLTTSISMANLENPAKEFSRIRLFGSFGWIGSGFLISALGIEAYSTPFLIGAGVSLMAGLYALVLPYSAPVKTEGKMTVGRILGFDAFKLTKDRSFLVLLVFSALICIPLAFYDSFTNLFITDIGIKNAAAAMSMGQIAEVIFLFSFPFFFLKLKYKGSITSYCGMGTDVRFCVGSTDGRNRFHLCRAATPWFLLYLLLCSRTTVCRRKSAPLVTEFCTRTDCLCYLWRREVFRNIDCRKCSALLYGGGALQLEIDMDGPLYHGGCFPDRLSATFPGEPEKRNNLNKLHTYIRYYAKKKTQNGHGRWWKRCLYWSYPPSCSIHG